MFRWLLLIISFVFTSSVFASSLLDARFTLALETLNQKIDPKVELSINDLGANHYQIKDQTTDQIVTKLDNNDFYTLYIALKQVSCYLLKTRCHDASQLEETDFSSISFSPNSFINIAVANNPKALTNNDALHQITTSLILLSFFTEDSLDQLKVLKANAWMTLALYEAKTSLRNQSLLVMLASSLGYDLFAEYGAKKLKPSPLYFFYQGLEFNHSSTFSKLLHTRRSAIEHNSKVWIHSIESMKNDPVSPSFMLYSANSIDAYNVRSKLLLLYPLFVVNDYFNNQTIKQELFNDNHLDLTIENTSQLSNFLIKDIPFSANLLIVEFTKLIETNKLNNGILSENLIFNYWQSRLYNAYYQIAIYLVKTEPDKELALNLLSVFHKNIKSEVGLILYSWYKAFLSDTSYQDSVNMFSLIVEMPNAPIKLLEELYEWQYFLRPSRNKAYKKAHQELLSRLDSRYQHQTLKFKLDAEFNKISKETLKLDGYDYQINEDIIVALDYLKDVRLLKKALNQTKLVNQRIQILSFILKYDPKDTKALNDLATIYKKHPNSFFILKKYVNVLLNYTDNPKDAIEVLNAWIFKKNDLSRKDYLDLISLIAKARLQVGDLDAAWSAIIPTLRYFYPKTILIAADITLKQKRIKKTNELIAEYRRSFPYTIYSLSYQIKSLILQKSYYAAADLIKNWYYPINDEQFKTYVLSSISEMNLSQSDRSQLIFNMRKLNIARHRIKMIEQLK